MPSTKRSRSEVWTGGAGDVGDMGGEASETAVAGEVEVEVWVLEEPEEPRAGSGSMMLMQECLGVEVGERERARKDETGEEGLAMTGSGGGTVMERAAKGLTNGVTCMEAAWKREGVSGCHERCRFFGVKWGIAEPPSFVQPTCLICLNGLWNEPGVCVKVKAVASRPQLRECL